MLVPNIPLFAEFNDSEGNYTYSLPVVALHPLPHGQYNPIVVMDGQVITAKVLPGYVGIQYFDRSKAKKKEDDKSKKLLDKEST